MASMFMIPNTAELQAFITQNNMKDSVGWEVNTSNNRVYFRIEKKEQKEIPATKMINLNLEYATEMNRII